MTRSARFALTLLAACASCKHAEPPAGFGVNLTIDASALAARRSVHTLVLLVSGAEAYTTTLVVDEITVRGDGIVRARYVPGVDSGALSFSVVAKDAGDSVVGLGSGGPVDLVPGKAVAVDIRLQDGGDNPDLATPDLTSTLCSNGLTDGDETDVDCGGSCTPCEPSRACKMDEDCATQTCLVGRCELASGPPSWVSLDNLPSGRTFAAAASLDNGKVYLLGGSDGTDAVAAVLVYSLETNGWTAGTPLPSARFRFPAVAQDNTIYALGGLDQTAPSTYAPLDEIAAFTGGAWNALSRKLTSKRNDHVAVLGGDGRIYVAGGRTHPATTALATFESFDAKVDAVGTATAEASLPSARFFAGAATDASGRILVAGGNDGTATVLRRVDAYYPNTKTWTTAPDLLEARDRHGAALGGDGRVYVVGGAGASALKSVEALSTDGARWVSVPALGTARFGVAVTRGWDNRVYAIGGSTDVPGPLTTVEAYGPRIIAGPSSAQAGKQVAISGQNFAAKAKVSLSFAGSVVATGSTNTAGAIMPSLSWQVPPSLTVGTYELTVVDDRARYPARLHFEVVP